MLHRPRAPWQGGASGDLRGAEDPRAQEAGWVFVRFHEISWDLVGASGANNVVVRLLADMDET